MRPPKPTPRTNLKRKVISSLRLSKKKGSFAVSRNRNAVYDFSKATAIAKPEIFNANKKTEFDACDGFSDIRLPSLWIEGPKACTELKPVKSTSKKTQRHLESRLRSSSDPRDSRFHNYVNYPIKSAPERIGDDGRLDTKLYIAESISTSSIHDYVNLATELQGHVYPDEIVRHSTDRPNKPPRFTLIGNSRKVSPNRNDSSKTENPKGVSKDPSFKI